MSRSQRSVRFSATDDARAPYAALVDGEAWRVRVNEFPEEPSLYTLIVDGKAVEELMTWPIAWQRPDPTDEDPHERAEFERDVAHTEQTRGVRPSKLVK